MCKNIQFSRVVAFDEEKRKEKTLRKFRGFRILVEESIIRYDIQRIY